MGGVLIVTDAWRPQTNGVVRCLESLADELGRRGIEVNFLTPEGFLSMPAPTYPDIRLALATPAAVAARIAKLRPHHIHIATEGPLGMAARRVCRVRGLGFTTSYHTRFPEYVAARVPIPLDWTYRFLRWFHGAAAATLAPTASMREELLARGFRNVRVWTRGVDHAQFHPGPKSKFADLPGPHLLYVGRVSVEKNLEAFLSLDVPGTKIVVGDGPARAPLEVKYPAAKFLGMKYGAELAAHYRSADVFVFPSRTDTFGNVITEALASGVPVAAYPVTGPRDILTDPEAGAMDEDLGCAVRRALTLSRVSARQLAEQFTWARCADIFLDTLVPVRRGVTATHRRLRSAARILPG